METRCRIHDHAAVPLGEYPDQVNTQTKLPWRFCALGVWTLSGHLQRSNKIIIHGMR